MCVIIITTPENPISDKELRAAWDTNPDGAGYAYPDGENIHFKRGFMDFKKFNKEVQKLQQTHPLMLHLRISTCGGVEPINTHPYKVGNLLKMNGETKNPVICMNGIIYGQKLTEKRGHLLNDTASYILKYNKAFKVINKDILNIIANDTQAKWAATTSKEILTSDNFKTVNGRKYSNINHLNYYHEPVKWDGLELEDLIKDTNLLNKVYSDWDLCDNLDSFIYNNCNKPNCKNCFKCISEAKTLKDLKEILQWDYWTQLY